MGHLAGNRGVNDLKGWQNRHDRENFFSPRIRSPMSLNGAARTSRGVRGRVVGGVSSC